MCKKKLIEMPDMYLRYILNAKNLFCYKVLLSQYILFKMLAFTLYLAIVTFAVFKLIDY